MKICRKYERVRTESLHTLSCQNTGLTDERGAAVITVYIIYYVQSSHSKNTITVEQKIKYEQWVSGKDTNVKEWRKTQHKNAEHNEI